MPLFAGVVSPTQAAVLSQSWKDCFLQKEARVCVSDAIVLEDSKFKWCFFFVVEDEQVIDEVNVNIAVEWKGILAEGTVVWND